MRLILVLVLASLLTACSSAGYRDTPPEVQLTDLRLAGASLLSTEFIADVEIQNLSPDPIPVRGSRYTLKVNGVDLGSAVSNESFTVPALGSFRQSIPFRLSHVGIATGTGSGVLNATRLNYQVDGTLFLRPRGELRIDNSATLFQAP